MTQARRRLRLGPLGELFFLLRGPGPGGARWRGLLVVAIDGTIMTVADSEADLAVYSKQRGGPTGRATQCCGCWSWSAAGPALSSTPCSAPSPKERPPASRACSPACAGMILLADRNFGAGFLAAQSAGTGADFLIRVKTGTASPGPRS